MMCLRSHTSFHQTCPQNQSCGHADETALPPAANLPTYAANKPNARLQVPMENVVLIIHLLLALALIGVVLMQRSEGGGLGMGGGGGGAVSGRSAATALTRVTWVLAAAFICTSIALTVIAANKSASSSVFDRLGTTPPAAEESAPLLPGAGDSLLPPAEGDSAPLVPRAD